MTPWRRPAARSPEAVPSVPVVSGPSRRQALWAIAGLAAGRAGRARAASDGPPLIDPELRSATAQGRVRVLVELRLPDGAPAPGGPTAQERAIAAVQQAVLARLAPAPHRLVHRYTSVPLLALEIGADALRALETMSDLVIRVRADRVRIPSTPR
jgi:hypothetical protein